MQYGLFFAMVSRIFIVRICMKWFLMAVCLLYGSINLFANTNPFMLNTNQRDFQVQQKNKGKKFLSTESIQLPSNARELKSVTFTSS